MKRENGYLPEALFDQSRPMLQADHKVVDVIDRRIRLVVLSAKQLTVAHHELVRLNGSGRHSGEYAVATAIQGVAIEHPESGFHPVGAKEGSKSGREIHPRLGYRADN